MGYPRVLSITLTFFMSRKGVIHFADFVRAVSVSHPSIPLEEKFDFKLSSDVSFLSILIVHYFSRKKKR